MKKRILTALLLIFVILGIGSLFIFKVNFNKEVPKDNMQENNLPLKPYGYDQLNEFEQELYDYMEKREMKEGDIYYFDEPKDAKSINKVQELYREHNYYLCSDYCYGAYLDYSLIEPVEPGMYDEEPPATGIKAVRVLFPDEKWKEKKEAAENKAKEVVANMPKDLSKLEQIQYLYDYVINNVEYEDIPENDTSSSYAGLILGKAVCQGYARTFEELAKAAGFNVLTISGEVLVDYQGHAWNMIEYNGHWYHLEPTWEYKEYDAYKYFMLSDEEHSKVRISRNIRFTDDIPAPKADKPLSERERTSIKRK